MNNITKPDLREESLLTEQALQAVNRYQYGIDHLYHEAAKSFGFSDAEFYLLYLLNDARPLALSELADYSGLPRQTAHSCLKKLMEKGFLQTEVRSPRRVLYSYTEKGKQELLPHIHTIRQMELDALDRIGAEKASLLAELLTEHLESLQHSFRDLKKDQAVPAKASADEDQKVKMKSCQKEGSND